MNKSTDKVRNAHRLKNSRLTYILFFLVLVTGIALACASRAPSVAPIQFANDRETSEPALTLLEWLPVADATSYRVQITASTDTSFTSPIVSQVIRKQTSYEKQLPSGEYLWRVRGRNFGGAGPWSEVKKFTVRN